MVIDFDIKKITYLDPLSGSRDRKAKYVSARTIKVLTILKYIDESDIKKWTDISRLNIQYQENDYDCGIYLLAFAEMFAHNQSQPIYDFSWIKDIDLNEKRMQIKNALMNLSDWRNFLATYSTQNKSSVATNLYAEVCAMDPALLDEESKPIFFQSLYDPEKTVEQSMMEIVDEVCFYESIK